VASINFQLNLGYALTFLLAGSALASLWMGWRNVYGVQLQLGALPAVFQGERATVPVQLHIAQGMQRERYGLSIAMNRTQGELSWVHTNLATTEPTVLQLGSVPHQRGWHRVPRVVMESRFPLGVFRIWSYWQPTGHVMVYPTPEPAAPPIPSTADADAGAAAHAPHTTSVHDGLRHYQRGDALRHVVWKKTATALATGSSDWVVREHASSPSRTLWLAAQSTGLTDTEAQIARLTAWVLHAHAQQWQWGLQLPSGHCIAPASGELHLQNCLVALALDGKTTSQSEVMHQIRR